MSETFLWFDLETFGRDPGRTRIAQFAGVRTDIALRPIGEPAVHYCQPADDLLPSPTATLITGITPQHALREGLVESAFMATVHEQLAEAGTCAVGYNSLRFDDEFIRCSLYRNFFDPYEREWKNGNSRWDLLDLMRLCHALRPDGLEWPKREDGMPSFKLEHLARANGIEHLRAHDALSDVEALIALARRVREAQPKLFDFYFALRRKARAAALLDVANMTPVLHVSGRFPAERGCAGIVVPLCAHPTIGNRVITFDLDADPSALIELSADDIADRLFVASRDLPEGEQRIPLKEIHLNRCPALVELRHVSDAELTRLQLDRARADAHLARLREAPDLAAKLRQVFGRERDFRSADADQSLYAGFLPDRDRALLPRVRSAAPATLDDAHFGFSDARYAELLFRYRARNHPDSLDAAGRERWNSYRLERLTTDCGRSEYSFDSHLAEIAVLRMQHAGSGETLALLDALEDWNRTLARELG